MESIAQTNVQLYNQLQRQSRSAEELALVRRAYELARGLNSGYFMADGKPFTAHVIGVASIVAQLELSSHFVAAACLHNVYTAADFGDGLGKCVTGRRRKIVATAVGAEVEDHVHRFWTLLRASPIALPALIQRIDTLTPQDRQLAVIDLADALEKCHDLGPLYYGDHEPMIDYIRREGPALIALAKHLDHPALAAMLADAFSRFLSATVSQSLRSDNALQKYARLEISRSLMWRPSISARRRIRRLWRRFNKAGFTSRHRGSDIAQPPGKLS